MDRTPLRGREYAALQTLFAMVSGFTACLDSIRERSERAGCWEHMEAVGKLASECLDAILQTVPDNKLMHIRADLQNVRLYIKVEPPGLTRPCEGFSYTPTETLNELLNYLCQHECGLCDKTAGEGRKCQYRKLIESALPHEVDIVEREYCKYSDMTLGLEAK